MESSEDFKNGLFYNHDVAILRYLSQQAWYIKETFSLTSQDENDFDYVFDYTEVLGTTDWFFTGVCEISWPSSCLLRELLKISQLILRVQKQRGRTRSQTRTLSILSVKINGLYHRRTAKRF